MALPYVKINFSNGSLGSQEPMDDGVTLMLLSGFSADIDCLNYEDFLSQNSNTDKPEVAAFYHQAGRNTRLIISSDTLSEANLKALLAKYNGEIRTVVINDVDDAATITLLESVGTWATTTLFAPVLFLVQADETYINTVPDFKALEKSRVAVVDSLFDADETPILYYVAGRLAVSPVQRSLARVKDGSLFCTEVYNSSEVLVDNTYAETRHAKGLITARVYIGKSGFYISDDPMTMPATDDYALIPRRRTIDKAYRIAYKTLVDYIGEEIPATDSGNIPSPVCKEIENAVERAVYTLMTTEGNLGVDSTDPSDTGVICYVDPQQNVVSTSKLNIILKVKPYGYAKYIEVNLGFYTNK